MKLSIKSLITGFFLLQFTCVLSQDIHFAKVLDGSLAGLRYIRNIIQDKQGYIWISTSGGLYRYDGSAFKPFINKAGNKDASLKNGPCLTIDKTGIIWIGTSGAGIEKFDPETNSFMSFQHNTHDASTLINDTIISIMADHLNNIWVGTINGLDKLDGTNGKFIHYAMNKKPTSNITTNCIYTIYEDKQGIIWAGYGNFMTNLKKQKSIGGLSRLDSVTGQFTNYFNSDENNKFIDDIVLAIFEDSKGNLWMSMKKNELQMLDKKTGKFIRFPYDSTTPEKADTSFLDISSFITEDKAGGIWTGTYIHGINRYDLFLNKKMHYGSIATGYNQYNLIEDTVSGFKDVDAISYTFSKDGTLWVGTNEGNLYKAVLPHIHIPYVDIQSGANSFYEQNDSILWIGTSIKGLDKRNIKTGKNTWFTNKEGNPNLPPDHDIVALRADVDSNLWIGTYGGLYKLNLTTNIFSKYLNDVTNNNSTSGDTIQCLFTDKQNVWAGIYGYGLDKINIKSGIFTHYYHSKNDSNSIITNSINCITEDKNNDVWLGTVLGLDRLNQKTNKFTHYLNQSEVLSICIDSGYKVWVGTTKGFYYFDVSKNKFTEYVNYNSPVKIANVLHILEDNQHNLWLTTSNAILKIDVQENAINVFDKKYGVHFNNYYDCDNYKLKNGQLLIGDQSGYYLIAPTSLQINSSIFLNFTSFKIKDEEIELGQGSVLTKVIEQTKEIMLNYNQNTFSFEFNATDYSSTGETKYVYTFENYDNSWRDIGAEHKAYFFNVSPGKYIFRVKAISPDGVWAEKSISVFISPPWWKTWWAYTIFTLLLFGVVWSFIYYRSLKLLNANRLLEEKVNNRTEQLNKSLENLKASQTQLIQSEKMASLGELTAGIAHEIQNPLNFVNNFSEVNTELIEEMKTELRAGNNEEAIAIADDIKENEEKIKHHGKRADAIVKGMLQHSQSSSGLKEPTDINKLADEYLRLSYHGLRSKDKNFNATMKTEFDQTIGKINIVPQDIGRVLLNLYNNAFYAVAEKKKQQPEGYEPTVSVSTKKDDDKIFVSVKDNGKGIPQKIVDKIFQPFFTTKPTGQGTGLGLSLSYDIIKAHGGEIKVESKEGEGTEFIFLLPLNQSNKQI